MVSKARLDFPEPESPVMTISLSRGISTETFLRLCTRAPCTAIVVRAVARLFDVFFDDMCVMESTLPDEAWVAKNNLDAEDAGEATRGRPPAAARDRPQAAAKFSRRPNS